jgi:hypothetical protein
MQWTMPPRVLQIVASLLALAAAASFVTGVLHAPQRGRLPGEKASSSSAPSLAIEAPDATPLSNERIEGPPPPAANEEADEEKTAEADAGNSDVETTPVPVRPPPLPGNALVAPPTLAPLGNSTPTQTLGGPPAPDEPPH